MTAPIYEAALELQEPCRSMRWSFCFNGGLAVQRWGEPRFTQGVDISLQTGFGGEGPYIDALLELKGSTDAEERLRTILAEDG